MKFDRALVPAGTTAKKLRDFLNRFRHVGWAASDDPPGTPDPPYRISRTTITDWFKRDLADALVANGLLERTAPGKFRVTAFGNRMGPQRLNTRISRARADKIVAEFLDRVHQANADPEAVLLVVEVIAFGSYIRDTDDLGDIDLVVMTAPRPMSSEEWHRRLDALNAKAEAAGKEYWPGRDLKLRLRNRNRHLSFHPEFELRDSDDRKVIFSSPIEGNPEPHAI
jgi:hypothetical protein